MVDLFGCVGLASLVPEAGSEVLTPGITPGDSYSDPLSARVFTALAHFLCQAFNSQLQVMARCTNT